MYSQRDFYNTILAVEGKPCLARLVTGVIKPYFKHDVFDSIDDFCDALDKLDYTRSNFYHCVSTLKSHSYENDKGVKRVRTQENTQFTRCFILDVDIRDKPGHYTTKEAGLAGIQAVVEGLGLPQPIIVDSGFGYHVYWPMAGGVPSAEWRKTAELFKRAIAVIAPEIVADGSRVADSAGVLRIPGSFNHKNKTLTPVTIVQWYSDWVDYGRIKDLVNRVAGAPTTNIKATINAAVHDTGPADFMRVAKNCNWTKQYLKNQATEGEPAWYAMLGLVPYMIYSKSDGTDISGPKLAHLISKNHVNYDEQATYLKYMQAKNGQTGPTTCSKLQSIDSSRCEGCPFAATVKSPVQTAKLDREATKPVIVDTVIVDEKGEKENVTVTIPLPPKPYFRGENGGVYVRTKVQDEKTGQWDERIEKVYDYDIYPTKRFRNESIENEQMEIHVWLPQDGLRVFKLQSGLLADSKALSKYLSEKGVVPEFNKGAGLTRYLITYARTLQLQKAAEVEFSRFGWREIHGVEPKFVVSDGYIDKKGELHPSAYANYLGSKAASAVTATGSLEAWKEGFNMYTGIPESNAYILAALAGFAAPLMSLTDYKGVLYNMVGDSGGGKSTSLAVMASVFGAPIYNHLLHDDTAISAFNHIGYLNNVAVSFDEMTKMNPDALSTFALSFTSGRGKMRAGRDGHNVVNETQWDTIVAASSNVSLYTKLADHRKGYSAEAMRVFQLNVDKANIQYSYRVNKCMQLLKENHGIAGREYIKYIIPRITQVKRLIEMATQKIAQKAKLRNEERFWCAFFATVLIGGKISRDVLKLHNYPVEEIVEWAMKEAKGVRETIASSISDPISMLSEFFNSNLDSILRIKEGRPSLSGMQGNMRSVKARIEYAGDTPVRAYISVGAIQEYCKRINGDVEFLRMELARSGILLRACQKRLASGTDLPNISLRVWEIDMTHEKLSEITIEEDLDGVLPAPIA